MQRTAGNHRQQQDPLPARRWRNTLECLTCGLGTSGDRAPQQGTPVQLPPAVPRSLGNSGAVWGAHMWPTMPKRSEPGSRSQFSTLTSAPPLKNISFAAHLWSCWSSSPSRFSTFPLFLPLKLLLNIIPHMYSLLFFEAESHFIVSFSYFLLLSRSLCNVSMSSVGFATFSCLRSLANGLNNKPVPSFFPFPIYSEWSQFHETPATLEAHSVPCPIGEHLILVTVFLCSPNGQITAVAGALTASCASAMGICPSCWAMCHKIPVWAPVRRPQVSQHCGVAALHQTLHSAGLSAASPGGEVGTGGALSQYPGVCQCPQFLKDTQSQTELPSPQEPTTALAQGWIFSPCCRDPLPLPALTVFVIFPQKCCPNFLAYFVLHTWKVSAHWADPRPFSPGLWSCTSHLLQLLHAGLFTTLSLALVSFHLLLSQHSCGGSCAEWEHLGHLVHEQRHSFIWKIPSHLTSKVTSSKYQEQGSKHSTRHGWKATRCARGRVSSYSLIFIRRGETNLSGV